MLIEQRGRPGMIVSDNGTEFTRTAPAAVRNSLVKLNAGAGG